MGSAGAERGGQEPPPWAVLPPVSFPGPVLVPTDLSQENQVLESLFLVKKKKKMLPVNILTNPLGSI